MGYPGCFNPTRDRLKPAFHPKRRYGGRGFNPTRDRLKPTISDTVCLASAGFNPTRDRLKHGGVASAVGPVVASTPRGTV